MPTIATRLLMLLTLLATALELHLDFFRLARIEDAKGTIFEFLQPQLTKTNVPKRGTVVIGTAEGDMHDIGKDLIGLMLKCSGFEVEDLGTDVLPDAFVEGVRRSNANIVAISALLTTTMYAIPAIIEALSEAGLRERVKILIGGAPITRRFADQIGADGFGEDFVAAVDEADRLMAL